MTVMDLNFEKGNKVKIIDNKNFHGFDIGEVVEIISIHCSETGYIATNHCEDWCVDDSEIEVYD